MQTGPGHGGHGVYPDPVTDPLAGNPLESRADHAVAVRQMFEPLLPYFSPGGCRVVLGRRTTPFSPDAAALEGFARPLWGLVPLGVGGHDFAHWDLYRNGLCHGADPGHPEYWGGYDTADQRMVEQAAIAYALAAVPDELWHPLPERAREQLAAWLQLINRVEPFRNNWQWFRILVNTSLDRLGVDVPAGANDSAFEVIHGLYAGDGWYRDGPPNTCDLYVGSAFHYYGLLYSTLVDDEPASVFRDRAGAFAKDWSHWFDATGRVVPFGRSLGYRFAAGAFWAALAAADVEALPWGRIRGLLGRHLRDWSTAPIWRPDGILSVGYSYPNETVGEEYISDASPYWAMKSFAAAAVPDDHPFWTTPEEPLETPRSPMVMRTPGTVLFDAAEDQAVALSARHEAGNYRQGAARYAKFAYSSRFGFSLTGDGFAGHEAAPDSMLALCDGDGPWRVRTVTRGWGVVDDTALWVDWQPWADVSIRTVLWACPPGHVRVHSIRNSRGLRTIEGGFATGIDEAAASHAVDLGTHRRVATIEPPPTTNIVEPRTVLPVLEATLQPGSHTLVGWFHAGDAREDVPPAVPRALIEIAEAHDQR